MGYDGQVVAEIRWIIVPYCKQKNYANARGCVGDVEACEDVDGERLGCYSSVYDCYFVSRD